MTFKKDPNITYTQMAIYVDENIYKESFDEVKIFEYCYHICFMLARNGSYFKKYELYDRFAIFFATQVYLRLTNKKQFEYDENGNPKLDKIRSVLNYCKKTSYQYKIQFEQSEYAQTLSEERFELQPDFNFDTIMQSYIDKLNFCEFGLTFENIDKTCRNFLSSIPYKTGTVIWKNIYLSVILTFLDKITLTIQQKERIEHLKRTGRYKDYHLNNFFDELNNSPPILFHLPSHMSNYIQVLTRQLRHLIAKDLTDILHTNISSDINLYQGYNKDISEIGGYDEN